jgi:SAM-dependent methyltransferase
MSNDEHYDRAYYAANGQLGDRPALRWYTALAERYLSPGLSGHTLDVGCGTGHFLRRLAATGPADGLEVSAFSAAQSRLESPTSTVYTDGSDLPPNTYTRFTAIHVVEHMSDDVLDIVLSQLRAAATPDAKYLVVTPDLTGKAARLHGSGWNAFTDPTHINLKSHADWRAFFVDRGFSIDREGSDGMWNFPYSSLPVVLDAGRYGLPMAAQFLTGRLAVAPGEGESSLFVLSRRD